MTQKNTVIMFKKTLKNTLFSAGIALLTTGCISATGALGIDTSSNIEQDKSFSMGDYNRSATLAVNDKDKDATMDNDNLLPTLKAGNAYLYAKNYEASANLLNEAESIIKYQREQALLGSVGDYTAKLLLNDAAVEFQANMTDSIMMNTYKSLALMSANKFDDARVELNRAIDRQRRAKEVYAELIGKQKEAIAEKSEKSEKKSAFDFSAGLNKTINDASTKKKISSHYSNLNSFQAYPDFVNPFTTYLAGLYFQLNGDYQKSVDLLKEASAMIPNNKVIASDFKMVDGALSGKKINQKYVWIIFENGLAPIKKEFKIKIPVYLVSSEVNLVTIALPEFQKRKEAFPFIQVNTKGQKNIKTQLVADMDRVMLTEFKYGYNDIVTRALLSAALKAFAEYQTKQNLGAYAGMGMSVFNSMTSHADTRSWTTLPKNFQVAKVKMPKDGLLDLVIGNAHQQVPIAKDAKNAIVYVRVPTPTSVPSLSVINF